MKKERKRYHIVPTLDYAFCLFSEGLLQGIGEFNISDKEVMDIQDKITGNLLLVFSDIEKLKEALK